MYLIVFKMIKMSVRVENLQFMKYFKFIYYINTNTPTMIILVNIWNLRHNVIFQNVILSPLSYDSPLNEFWSLTMAIYEMAYVMSTVRVRNASHSWSQYLDGVCWRTGNAPVFQMTVHLYPQQNRSDLSWKAILEGRSYRVTLSYAHHPYRFLRTLQRPVCKLSAMRQERR